MNPVLQPQVKLHAQERNFFIPCFASFVIENSGLWNVTSKTIHPMWEQNAGQVDVASVLRSGWKTCILDSVGQVVTVPIPLKRRTNTLLLDGSSAMECLAEDVPRSSVFSTNSTHRLE